MPLRLLFQEYAAVEDRRRRWSDTKQSRAGELRPAAATFAATADHDALAILGTAVATIAEGSVESVVEN